MIDTWRLDPTDENLSALWGHLCHQGTVYSASFAAIPLLLAASTGISHRSRRDMLLLIAGILASPDIASGDGPDVEMSAALPSLESETLGHLHRENVDEVEAIYLLQAAAAFRGDRFWGTLFSQLASEEFSARCSLCAAELYFAFTKSECFCSAGDWVRNPLIKRNPVAPAAEVTAPQELVAIASQAKRYEWPEITDKVRYIVGASTCPACSMPISVLDSIRNWADDLFQRHY